MVCMQLHLGTMRWQVLRLWFHHGAGISSRCLRLQFPPNWTYRCGMPLERVAGWCVFFFEHGETDGMAQHSKVYLVLGLFEPARELFLTKMQPRRVCSMPTFSNFLRNIFCRLCGTIGVLCLSFQDSWRARRLFSTWWLRVVVHKHGMCLDGIWLFQLLWLQEDANEDAKTKGTLLQVPEITSVLFLRCEVKVTGDAPA